MQQDLRSSLQWRLPRCSKIWGIIHIGGEQYVGVTTNKMWGVVCGSDQLHCCHQSSRSSRLAEDVECVFA
jgi:hypothetical protein